MKMSCSLSPTLTFACWVYATVASKGRIALSFDGGSTFTYSTYHSGNSVWELLFATAQVPTTATSVRAYTEAAASATVYYDASALYIYPIYRLTVPSGFSHNMPNFVKQQDDQNNPNGTYTQISWENPPIPGRI